VTVWPICKETASYSTRMRLAAVDILHEITERCSRLTHEHLVDLRQLHQSLLNNGINLRCALDLAVSTFALDHPLPRFDTFP
jgi:hypothetical protein